MLRGYVRHQRGNPIPIGEGYTHTPSVGRVGTLSFSHHVPSEEGYPHTPAVGENPRTQLKGDTSIRHQKGDSLILYQKAEIDIRHQRGGWVPPLSYTTCHQSGIPPYAIRGGIPSCTSSGGNTLIPIMGVGYPHTPSEEEYLPTPAVGGYPHTHHGGGIG